MSPPGDDLDPFLQMHLEDPHAIYETLRDRAPVCRQESRGFITVARYEDAVAVLGDPFTYSNAKGIGPTRNDVVQRPTMLTRDPPEHTRLRGLVAKAFTPRRVAEFEPLIAQLVDSLLGKCLARGEMDVVADLARPLPSLVVAHILDVEPGRLGDFQRWSDDIFRSVVNLGDRRGAEQARRSYQELDAYFSAKIAERRAAPRADLLGGLVVAEENCSALTVAEILDFAMLLFVAGNETTTNLIANAVALLVGLPAEAEALRANPDKLPDAVEEVLRFESPVQGIFRTTRRAVTLGGVLVPKDQKVCVLLGSANRDPARFADPQRFDPRRRPNPHLAFGQGIHYCIGASLARVEAKVALRMLLERTSGLARAGAAVRYPSPLVRGFERLPVRVLA